jgi:hypothetical protein
VRACTHRVAGVPFVPEARRRGAGLGRGGSAVDERDTVVELACRGAVWRRRNCVFELVRYRSVRSAAGSSQKRESQRASERVSEAMEGMLQVRSDEEGLHKITSSRSNRLVVATCTFFRRFHSLTHTVDSLLPCYGSSVVEMRLQL